MITVGLDIGTTNSAIAVNDGNSAQIVEAPNGHYTMPSVVEIEPSGKISVGTPIIQRSEEENRYVFYNIKRYVGQQFNEDEHDSIKHVRGDDGYVWWQGPDRIYSTPELYSHIVKELLKQVELKHLQRPTGVVVTVPANFTEPQLQQTRKGVELAGIELDKIHVRKEPTAAALHAGANIKKFKRYAVYDLGGGTFDISIVNVKNGEADVITSLGDQNIGGANFDEAIARYLSSKWQAEHGDDLMSRSYWSDRLIPKAEEAKKVLSSKEETTVKINHLTKAPDGSINSMNEPLSKTQFNDLTEKLIQGTLQICKRCLANAREQEGDKYEVDNVILVGGMTRVPAVREAVEAFFGKPVLQTVNPEQAVALGASTIGAIIDGRTTGANLRDKVGTAYGIENENGQMTVIIKQNSSYPIKEVFQIGAASAVQKACSLRIIQGNSMLASMCDPIGENHFEVSGCKRGDPKVEVEFDIDESGMLKVFAAPIGQEKQLCYGGA